ncbi:hypothetical protein C1645_744631 [Glomus cerebriforme]|uniref:Uncharacterized protein n=1 Tax=Glomus cerebriforme TaxID=658196 RepID=A0A397S970_9GLOM|nr:hypothetical protein C1645_744631 [Glomus cerebriforme]
MYSDRWRDILKPLKSKQKNFSEFEHLTLRKALKETSLLKDDNMTHLVDMMIKQNSITEDILILMNKLLEKLENKNILSDYRDWISYFCSAVQGNLNANVWLKVQFAIYRKVKNGRINYTDSEKASTLELEKVLKGVNMLLCDYEMLIL